MRRLECCGHLMACFDQYLTVTGLYSFLLMVMLDLPSILMSLGW